MIEPFVTLGTGIITGVVTLLGIWLRWRLNRLDRLAAPTGNGYAKRTEDLLERIDERTDRTDSRLDRLASRLDRIERTLTDHLEGR